MTIQRLLEAVMRIAKAANAPIRNVLVDIHEQQYATSAQAPTGLFRRKSTISVLTNASPPLWQAVGEADIDVNNMVIKIDYAPDAPWWAVNPFIDALEGK